jgi:hypothetical protein
MDTVPDKIVEQFQVVPPTTQALRWFTASKEYLENWYIRYPRVAVMSCSGVFLFQNQQELEVMYIFGHFICLWHCLLKRSTLPP